MNKLERKKQDYAWRDKAISFKVLQLVIEGEKVYTSVLVDPEWFDEDPGPTFYIDAVPNMYYLVSTTIHMYVRVYVNKSPTKTANSAPTVTSTRSSCKDSDYF